MNHDQIPQAEEPTRRSRFHAGLLDEYSPDELEFLRAIDRYKTENNRPFPTWCEVLSVLRSLGYRKVTGEV